MVTGASVVLEKLNAFGSAVKSSAVAELDLSVDVSVESAAMCVGVFALATTEIEAVGFVVESPIIAESELLVDGLVEPTASCVGVLTLEAIGGVTFRESACDEVFENAEEEVMTTGPLVLVDWFGAWWCPRVHLELSTL